MRPYSRNWRLVGRKKKPVCSASASKTIMGFCQQKFTSMLFAIRFARRQTFGVLALGQSRLNL